MSRTVLLFLVVCLFAKSNEVAADSGGLKKIVFLVAEGEYETAKTLPAFADQYLAGFDVTFVQPTPSDPNQFDNLAIIKSADLLVISVRRRTLPTSQLAMIQDYVHSGKPLVGLRTASHAFSLRRGDPPNGRSVWPEFDKQVFGGNYTNHHGNDLSVTIHSSKKLSTVSRKLLKGIRFSRERTSSGSLYKVSPLAESAIPVLYGEVEGHPAEPIAWTYQRRDGGRSFYTSLGHPSDFGGDLLPLLLFNAIQWGLE
ncbi:ThuA domain-containing protein [bacterium]|nr:ThuA domain-containing protein [Rubripirellula sp.]MDB4331663.1 ThuA domain-containing protein [bacterium]MDB4338579.1 ThuA domain-containing protein [Rubripirellula sp.]